MAKIRRSPPSACSAKSFSQNEQNRSGFTSTLNLRNHETSVCLALRATCNSNSSVSPVLDFVQKFALRPIELDIAEHLVETGRKKHSFQSTKKRPRSSVLSRFLTFRKYTQNYTNILKSVLKSCRFMHSMFATLLSSSCWLMQLESLGDLGVLHSFGHCKSICRTKHWPSGASGSLGYSESLRCIKISKVLLE